MTEIVDDGFLALADKITRDTAFRCASYKDKCLRRRIALRMRARGVASFAEYATLLDDDSHEYARLLDVLTINVTKFFRNWGAFESLGRLVIPTLWAKPGGIRVWSAGTASGEEAYSIAALFYKHAKSVTDPRLLPRELARVEIIGSDIDRASLAAAERAMYHATAFVDTPEDVAEQFFPRLGDVRTVLPAIRAMVQFERRDILLELPPPRTFDLIVCRNVIIYFDRVAQDELFVKFHQALAPDGYLLLGRVETLLGRPRALYTPVDLRERIFQRGDVR